GPCITAGIDAARALLQTDVIDIVHFHSCPIDVLQRQDVIEALLRGVDEGKIRVPAYSGDNEPLDYAIGMGVFKSIQTSVNIADQRVIDGGIRVASERGMGVIAKRPGANSPWRFNDRPHGHYSETYWLRLKEMNLHFEGYTWQELALRFTAYLPGVCTSIVG